MMRSLFYGLAAAAALVAGIGAQRWLGTALGHPSDVATLSESFPDLQGVTHHLDEWRGKVVVLNFWATWCPPCLEEMPAFSALQRELGGRGLQFIGLAIDETETVKRFIDTTPVGYPILIAEQGGEAYAARLGNRLGVLPFSAVFDRTGRLVEVHTGVFKPENLAPLLRRLLDEAP